MEGILRVSGTHREVAILKEKYAAGKRNINLNDYNIHSAGSLLSQYFSELPNPVFTFEMYDLWMATMCTCCAGGGAASKQAVSLK